VEREVAKELFEACERTIADLAAMEAAIGKIEDPEERATWMRSLGTALAEVLSHLRGPVVRQYPDLEPPPQLGEPDTVLNPEELLLVSQLTPGDVSVIDNALLAHCAQSWRKVARVVGSAMRPIDAKLEEVPVGYIVQRVVALVEAGHLESQGNLQYMRFSEVRLSPGGRSAA
jgi:hypothetical protein